MNFVAFIEDKGIVKSASGHKVEDLIVDRSDLNYPIKGHIVWDSGYRMPMMWNKNGLPHNLPLNHGVNLIPIVPIIKYESLSKEGVLKYS